MRLFILLSIGFAALSSTPAQALVILGGETQCEGGQSEPMPIAANGSVFDFDLNHEAKHHDQQPYKLVAVSDGVLVVNHELTKSDAGRDAMKRQLMSLFFAKDHWCQNPVEVLGSPRVCGEMVRVPVKIRNSKGQVIATAVPEKSTLKIKQAKPPFSANSFELDPEAPVFSFLIEPEGNKVTVTKKGEPINGKIQILAGWTPANETKISNRKFLFGNPGNVRCEKIPKAELALMPAFTGGKIHDPNNDDGIAVAPLVAPATAAGSGSGGQAHQ